MGNEYGLVSKNSKLSIFVDKPYVFLSMFIQFPVIKFPLVSNIGNNGNEFNSRKIIKILAMEIYTACAFETYKG